MSALLLGNRIVLQRAYAAIFFLLLAVSLNAWRQDFPIVGHVLSLSGWVLVAVGSIGRIWAGFYVSGRKTTMLVMEGPYSICRHPLYFFGFLGVLGVMLTTETLTFPVVFGACFAWYYRHLMAKEELEMRKLHGAAFEAYCVRTPRFFPKWKLHYEPERYTVSAALFRRNLMDAVWFVIAGGAVEFLEGMHTAGYIPTLLHIY